MWWAWALLSAVFAALTSVLSKMGLNGINSTLATAIRTCVVLAMSWGMVLITRAGKDIAHISGRNLWFLILSGLATGASWLCYFRALQMGETGKVAAVDKLSIVLTFLLAWAFVGEAMTIKTTIAAVLIVAGLLVMAL